MEPGDKGQGGVGALVADEILAALQRAVDDAGHALDLVQVALDGGGELFGVEAREPDRLAEVGALAGELEGEPLAGVVLLGEGGVGEIVGRVILFDEVLDDSAGFPQFEAGVGVLDCRDAGCGRGGVSIAWRGEDRDNFQGSECTDRPLGLMLR